MRKVRIGRRIESGFLALALAAGSAMPASACKLSPSRTEQERKVSALTAVRWARAVNSLAAAGIHRFTASVHEEITQKIYGCEGDGEACASGDMLYASPVVEVGRALRELNDARAPWERARPYRDCIFALADPQRPASAGADFRQR